jgi:ribosomal protein S18 acetylase RimI-like enzyme
MQSECRLRPMQVSDYDAIFALWKSLPGMGLSVADERDNISTFLDKNPGASFVAEREGVVVGTVLSGWDGRRGYLYHLAVAKNAQRQGIGDALMDEAEKKLLFLGAQRIHLMIYRDNDARAFYEKRGWYSRDHEISLMSKDLK